MKTYLSALALGAALILPFSASQAMTGKDYLELLSVEQQSVHAAGIRLELV